MDDSDHDSMTLPPRPGGRSYWSQRSHLVYYSYIDAIVRGFAPNVRSMIDVGSSDATYLEHFDWASRRVALDIRKPYRSPQVAGLKRDFLTYQPHRRFDLALCLQVLEHIEDAGTFARKLFDVADRVLISVPYKWEPGSSWDHKHDPVDLEKLNAWTGREPHYHIVVTEPLDVSPKGRRLIAYYAAPGKEVPVPKARNKLKEWRPS